MLPIQQEARDNSLNLISHNPVIRVLQVKLGPTVDTQKRLDLVVILSSGIPETYFEVSLNNKPHKQYYQLSEAMKEYCLLSVE